VTAPRFAQADFGESAYSPECQPQGEITVAQSEPEKPDANAAVTPAELRAPNLSFQALGYSRAETSLLLERAARTLEENASSLETKISDLEAALEDAQQRLAEKASLEPVSVEEAVGQVLVTAHRAAELVRNEAEREMSALLGEAREQARKIVEEADRQAEELAAVKARAEEELAKTEAEARALRDDAEREVDELHAEARRVRLVIDEFRNQLWELISEALRKLELRVPSGDARIEETETLHDDLRNRLPEGNAESAVPGETPSASESTGSPA
jgi:cell division septum initiation protein DivIVA